MWHLAGSFWVHTYLLLSAVGFQPGYKMVIQDLVVHLSLYSLPRLEKVWDIFFLPGVVTPWTKI